MIQLTLTLKVTTTQVVETSATVNNNSPIQHYIHPYDNTQPPYDNVMSCSVSNLKSTKKTADITLS